MTAPSTPAVEVAGVTKRYGDQAALSNLDLQVAPGEVLGFIGPNGAGKSTLLRLVAGLSSPTQGTVRVLGRDPIADPPDGVSVVVEHLRLVPSLSARANLRLLASVRGVAGDPEITAALEAVGLDPDSGKRAGAFSLGMRQRLAIAQAIMEQPRLLLLDEPTNGLDPEAIIALRSLIRDQADRGVAVILASHLLSEVEQVCDRVVLVARGVVRREIDLRRGQPGLVIRVDGEAAARRLEGWAETNGTPVSAGADGNWWSVHDPRPIPEVLRSIVTAGVDVIEARPGSAALEAEFLQILDGRPAL